MQRRKKESATAINKRVRRFRQRQRLRRVLSLHDSFVVLDLLAYYRGQNLSADRWIPAQVFFQGYQPEHQKLLMTRQLSGVERTFAVIGGEQMLLIRPKGLSA